MLCHGRWNCRLNAVLRLLLRRKRKDNLIENALFKQKLLTKVIGICLWPARYLAFIAHRDTLVWGECKVYRVKQKVLSRSQDALNCIAQTFTALHPLLTSVMFYYINSPKCSNGLPQFRLFWEFWRLLTAALSSVSPWGRRQNVFHTCFLSSTGERTAL